MDSNPAKADAADPEPSPDAADAARIAAGVGHGIGAYLWWGLVTTLYFRWLREVSPWELLAWRVLGGLPVLVLLLAVRRDLGSIGRALRDRPTRRWFVLSTLLIGANWFCFILAVVTGRVSEASLGYYINPLVSVALGAIFLGERLRPWQGIAVGIAAAGVTVLTVAQGSLPWISLVLAISFGLYGLLRKRMLAGPATGLAIEMLAFLPAMLVLEGALLWVGDGVFGRDGEASFGLIIGGVVTVVPLVLFASAARRLRLATVGLLQYIAPSAQLALAVLAFGEPFGPARALAFGFIWTAVLVYTVDSWRGRERTRRRGGERRAGVRRGGAVERESSAESDRAGSP